MLSNREQTSFLSRPSQEENVTSPKYANRLAKTLGERIRTIREKRGIGVNELARALEIARGYISEIERGKKLPTLVLLFRIADHLKIKMSEFFEGL